MTCSFCGSEMRHGEIPADFCPKCKKMIFETDILQT